MQRLVLGLTVFLVPARRLARSAILIKPATILKFHRLLVKRKYSSLYSNTSSRLGRPKIDKKIRDLVIEIKKKNPSFGCPQIALLVTDRTGVQIGIETVRRILKSVNINEPGGGPSWLSFLGAQVDSLWSVDMFQVESILLNTHWVMVVMDQYSRKIIGYAVIKGKVMTGENICFMFNKIISTNSPPKRLSHDNDPLFKFHLWKINMELLNIEEIRSVPFMPTSHPFVERVIGTTRRELIDKILFWNVTDLERKLEHYADYFNSARVHQGVSGTVPNTIYENYDSQTALPENLCWKKFCNGLFDVPIAA